MDGLEPFRVLTDTLAVLNGWADLDLARVRALHADAVSLMPDVPPLDRGEGQALMAVIRSYTLCACGRELPPSRRPHRGPCRGARFRRSEGYQAAEHAQTERVVRLALVQAERIDQARDES